ncbi:nuclear transport factor 2 family protein [Streptomyces sp. NK15101]|uniref:nuclear transport factor 2 family protein n=1 Tax=Streptomyces sp. NK15101 TaxID=2873261 RepID=UPI001CEC3A67|nr:nuclear transport factor 2 family protein [Streptomyces sp. NK15101]
MTETTVQDFAFAQLVEEYVRFWNTGTGQERHRSAAAAFAGDVEYRAPVGVLSGTQALTDFRDRFVGHMGTVEFRLRERPQTHHADARLAWEILTGDGTSFATGTDILRLDEDGRIRTVTVFLDRAPEGFGTAAHDRAEP